MSFTVVPEVPHVNLRTPVRRRRAPLRSARFLAQRLLWTPSLLGSCRVQLWQRQSCGRIHRASRRGWPASSARVPGRKP